MQSGGKIFVEGQFITVNSTSLLDYISACVFYKFDCVFTFFKHILKILSEVSLCYITCGGSIACKLNSLVLMTQWRQPLAFKVIACEVDFK